MEKSSTAFVGMDVHKESVDIAIADGREARLFGRVGGDAAAVERAVRKIRSVHRSPMFVYEAGPCGFWLYRRLAAQGLRCMVVSPSMTPRRAGDRVKTDRRDALKLCRLARAGELTAIHIPDEADEAVRDLVRTREDAPGHAAPGAPTPGSAAAPERHPLQQEDRLDRSTPALDRRAEASPSRAAHRLRRIRAGDR